MNFETYRKIHDDLMGEHQEKYDSFTRLMLGLSVTLVSLVIGLRSGDAGGLDFLLKFGLVLHSISILFGVWLQYIVMAQPIADLKKVYKLAQDVRNGERENPGWFSRNPSRKQVICFYAQIITFVAAFFIVVLSVVL
jgi:hypothetical protein|tara:strand:+ start:326 stop:736 length:411 start_codon:yes stop_codon:yes gene_type:complete